MLVQIRRINGAIENQEITNTVDFVHLMQDPTVGKMSFDFIDGSRLLLHPSGEYQILGGLVNYPAL